MNDDATGKSIERLRSTLRVLRGENGCPWDRERSIEEIISYMIDEAYELLQAERSGSLGDVEEELGDVFFLVVFVHELMLEKRGASLASIIERAHDKIIKRHPHVFEGERAADSVESTASWERIKKAEKPPAPGAPLLESIPSGLPPVRRAFALQKKAAGAGFDWPHYTGVIDKIHEETAELLEAVGSGDRDAVKDEVGDILFTAVNLARILDVDPESALEGASRKFKTRFKTMEDRIRKDGVSFESLTIEQLESYWQDSK